MYVEGSENYCVRIRCRRKLATSVETNTPLLSPCRRRRGSVSCDRGLESRRAPKCCGLEVPNIDALNRSKLSRRLLSGVSDESKQKLINAYLKRLSVNQLLLLDYAVMTKDSSPTSCIAVKDGQIRLGDLGIVDPKALVARIFRFGDAPPSFELKKHPWICKDLEGGLVCINPWHSSITSEKPPPAYDDVMRGETFKSTPSISSRSTSVRSSIATVCSIDDPNLTTWARIRYWEERTPIHRTYHITSSTVHVSDGPRTETGAEHLCLGVLHSTDAEASIGRTRAKIGRGVCLSKEDDGIWVYNLSDHPIFVHSCNDPFSVRRLAPKHCVNAFSTLADLTPRKQCPCSRAIPGPVDHRALRISFAKGWGPGYKRLDVTQCPCWLEVLLRRVEEARAPPLPPKA